MADEDDKSPEDALRDMLRDMLSGTGGIDPQKLAGAAGLPSDPAALQQLIMQLQGALRGNADGSINWDLALQQGRQLAMQTSVETAPGRLSALGQAFHVADLWLDEATGMGPLPSEPALLTRAEWVKRTMPLWTQLAEPVANSIADALTGVLRDQAPEELQGMVQNAGQMVRAVGGTLFAMQLGQVVGQLSQEVVSGGDIGIPLLEDGQAALLPQNVAAFGEGLDIPDDQVALYLAVRELAHARLFRHAKWLRLQVITAITEFARGIRIDTDRLEEVAASFDPSNPDELRDALASGALIPPKTEAQQAALARLENQLALIEGWVDVVTAQATGRLPKADSIAEMVRRRRAAGGPAESAFATLVGLELRPRRLREAAAMWQAVSDAVGPAARDELWSHPDIQPTGEDIDDPQRLIARLKGDAPADPEMDAIDQAIEDLLADDTTDRPHEE
ncbi:zinc-dependent metalloprotease [Gryllotalpicola ginsengisoli]|uniref:zinc-dependent metalloprotease n=1 Tax=Gryllotalpicola ginsengisoli TaxID=444608 RepID=UPI000412D82A|nr:zinc-dependent metalloprotease [Gryllotalpicola ginsengisoli]